MQKYEQYLQDEVLQLGNRELVLRARADRPVLVRQQLCLTNTGMTTKSMVVYDDNKVSLIVKMVMKDDDEVVETMAILRFGTTNPTPSSKPIHTYKDIG